MCTRHGDIHMYICIYGMKVLHVNVYENIYEKGTKTYKNVQKKEVIYVKQQKRTQTPMFM